MTTQTATPTKGAPTAKPVAKAAPAKATPKVAPAAPRVRTCGWKPEGAEKRCGAELVRPSAATCKDHAASWLEAHGRKVSAFSMMTTVEIAKARASRPAAKPKAAPKAEPKGISGSQTAKTSKRVAKDSGAKKRTKTPPVRAMGTGPTPRAMAGPAQAIAVEARA